MASDGSAHRDRSVLLRLLGCLLLLGGLAAGVAPLEIPTFSAFSTGGPFHYEGFGSLLFGIIAVQVLGYYLVALLAVPVGYGLLRLRRWAGAGALTLPYDWLILGWPLSVVLSLMLLTSKDLPPSSLPLLAACLVLIYPVGPLLLIWFFRTREVRLTFSAHDPHPSWTEPVPQRILVVSSLLLMFALALHIPMLFNGLFPLVVRPYLDCRECWRWT